MLQLFQPRPDLRAAHLFADHLEATLDLAEGLELLYLIPSENERAPGCDVLAGVDRIGAFVEHAEAIELAIAAKLELARSAARRIANADPRLSTFTKLFHAGTQPLVDLWPELSDPGKRIFDGGHDPLTFLQARGVIDESRATLEGQKYFGTGSDYRLLGTVKLADFIELCDTCLRAIDRHYHIYEDDADWEAGRARTLDSLRENRNEAIRVALGAKPAVIDAPVEIVSSDAVDEAIELIEALTFPEEKRFRPDHPLIEDATHLDDVPYALGPETMAEVRPIEIVEEAVSAAPQDLTVAKMPVDLAAEAVIDEPQTEASAVAEVAAVAPAARPSLFAPVAAAGRSLAAILARRKAAAAEAPQAMVPAAAAETEANSVDATPGPTESTDSLAAKPDTLEPVTAGVPAVTGTGIDAPIVASIADAVVTAHAVAGQLSAVRQRLVDVIAERAHSLPETVAFEPAQPETGPVTEDADLSAGPELEPAVDQETATPGSEFLARPIEIAPALPPIELPALDEQPTAQCMPESEIPAVEAETTVEVAQIADSASPVPSKAEDATPEIVAASADAVEAPSLAIEDVAPVLTAPVDVPESSEEASESSTTEAVAGALFPTDPEPTRRKRPRRKSRRQAAPRKRRTKRS